MAFAKPGKAKNYPPLSGAHDPPCAAWVRIMKKVNASGALHQFPTHPPDESWEPKGIKALFPGGGGIGEVPLDSHEWSWSNIAPWKK